MGIEQIIVVVVILVISFLNWAFKEGGLGDLLRGPQEPPQFPPPDTTRPRSITQRPPQTDDPGQGAERERMRRFFEALGVPAAEMPPPIQRQSQPAAPPPVPQPAARRPLATARGPVATVRGQVPPEIPDVPEISDGAAAGGRSIRRAGAATISGAQKFMGRSVSAAPELSKVEREALERLKKGRSQFPETVAHSSRVTRTKWAEVLRAPDAMRHAVVMREVLGPPKALQQNGGSAGYLG
jgi:hypothetical protein